jgi:hypothetical protein
MAKSTQTAQSGALFRSIAPSDLKQLLDSPIAYHRIFAHLVGDALSAIFLSQALYWTSRTSDPNGWFYKTQADWWAETALSRKNQESARRNLKRLGILEETRKGLPATMHFRINLERLYQLLIELIDQRKEHSRLHVPSKLARPKRADLDARSAQPPLYAETTAKTSSKNTAAKASVDVDELTDALIAAGASPKRAAIAAKQNPNECRKRLEYLSFADGVKNPGAWLTSKLEESYGPPPRFLVAETERAQRIDADRQRANDEARRQGEVAERDRHQDENDMLDGEFKNLPADEKAEIEDEAKRRCGLLAIAGRIPAPALAAARRNILRKMMGIPIPD